MNEDYRNTDYCQKLKQVEKQKASLEAQIHSEHSHVKIMYNQVHNKDGPYFSSFSKIYNGKCAYCGASIRFTDIRLFEVDHYICESAFGKDTNGKATAGKLNNLVFACFTCNRGKGDFLIKDGYREMLNPDDSSLTKIFYRDEDYYIKIRDEFKSDTFIKEFYDKLNLGFQTRRLDYLLLEMQGLLSKLSSSTLRDKLESGIAKLMEKKNCISYNQ